MKRRLLVLILFSLACRAALPATPTATSTAAPTARPATATAAPTATAAVLDDTAALAAVVQAMEAAVRARDQDTYLAHVDLTDPVFALEHTRWADEWAQAPLLDDFALAFDVAEVKADEATGLLTMTWQVALTDETRRARFPGRFTRGADGAWRYAGEQWVDTDTEHFRVRASPGLEAAAQAVTAALPAVYAHVTQSLEYTPAGRMEIKLYRSVEALVAATLLSLPPIHGWNEPGESLKLYAGDDAAPVGALAHEFTHFVEFDQAGTEHSRMPWWLGEGLAGFVAYEYAPSASQAEQVALVAAWAEAGELAPWATISVFEETPQALWRYVYPQGFAFVAFVTEVYGAPARNAWVRAMAVEMDIEAATPAVLGKSFEALDAEFRAWLAAGGQAP